MGNIGPDAFPDILTGQFVVHPGTPGRPDAWQVNDWLKWLLKGDGNDPRNKAFVYGYLGHAATDVFAHTYVNMYSGDIFILSDGEIEVEKRHVALETYIEERTPPLTDANGNSVGTSYEVLDVPAEFLRDRLILNPDVAEQYLIDARAPHLAAVYNLKEGLNSTYGSINEAEQWLTDRIDYYNGLINMNNAKADTILALGQEINVAIQNNSGISELQAAKNTYVDFIVSNFGMTLELQDQFDSALEDIISISAELDDVLLELAEKQAELAGIEKDLCESTVERVCDDVCKYDISGKLCKEVCKNVTKITCLPNPAYVSFELLVNEVIKTKQAIENELFKAHEALKAARNLSAQIALEAIQAENDIFNGMIDTAERMTGDLNLIRAQVNGWIKDIDDGMAAYIVASADTIEETMKPQGNRGPLKPLDDWLACWGAAITAGVPGPLNHTVCSVANRVENITDAVEDFENVMIQLDPVTAAWDRIKEKLLDVAYEAAEKAGYELAEKVTGIDVKQIVDLFREGVDAATLNNIFASDNSGKNLVLIGDIAERVDAEMYVTEEGYFDPALYSVAYNSVLFAKLALLGEEQLNQLAADAGVEFPTLYGDKLYSADAENVVNILTDAIRSIDGNHQWLGLAPPYPRVRSVDEFLWYDDERHRGYYGYDYEEEAGAGLRIWQDPSARDNIFRKIFHGPLVPGIEYPSMIGFRSVLPSMYRTFYDVCPSNPFPTLYDRSCLFARVSVQLPQKALEAIQNRWKKRHKGRPSSLPVEAKGIREKIM